MAMSVVVDESVVDHEAQERREAKARVRAARGASLFDRLFPEWWLEVRLTKLKMASGSVKNNKTGSSCVLAQISTTGRRQGTFGAGKRLVALQMPGGQFTTRQATYYGVNVSPNYSDDVQFRDLTEAWKDEIRARRSE